MTRTRLLVIGQIIILAAQISTAVMQWRTKQAIEHLLNALDALEEQQHSRSAKL